MNLLYAVHLYGAIVRAIPRIYERGPKQISSLVRPRDCHALRATNCHLTNEKVRQLQAEARVRRQLICLGQVAAGADFSRAKNLAKHATSCTVSKKSWKIQRF